MSKEPSLTVIVRPNTRPFYGTKMRKPGDVINLLPVDAKKHSEIVELKHHITRRPLLGEDKKPIEGKNLARWMIEYTSKALKDVLEEINPPEEEDPLAVEDPVTLAS